MPVFELEESQGAEDGVVSYAAIPEDLWLDATVTGIDQKKKPFQDDEGKDIWRVEFAFTVTGGDYNTRRLWGETSTTFTTHPDCKLRNWASELMGGVDLPKGFKLNTDALVGSPCRVQVGQRIQKGKDGGPDKTRNFVKDIMRPKGGAQTFEEPFS